MTAVPSDGWGQLLIYRKDLFDRAGLAAPKSLEDVRRAARRLDRGSVAGITLATGAQDSFTAETFEHVALAAGCQLVDGAGAATLNSTRCRAAFRLYVDLARSSSPRGVLGALPDPLEASTAPSLPPGNPARRPAPGAVNLTKACP